MVIYFAIFCVPLQLQEVNLFLLLIPINVFFFPSFFTYIQSCCHLKDLIYMQDYLPFKVNNE